MVGGNTYHSGPGKTQLKQIKLGKWKPTATYSYQVLPENSPIKPAAVRYN